jgi:hypothetical protein
MAYTACGLSTRQATTPGVSPSRITRQEALPHRDRYRRGVTDLEFSVAGLGTSNYI